MKSIKLTFLALCASVLSMAQIQVKALNGEVFENTKQGDMEISINGDYLIDFSMNRGVLNSKSELTKYSLSSQTFSEQIPFTSKKLTDGYSTIYYFANTSDFLAIGSDKSQTLSSYFLDGGFNIKSKAQPLFVSNEQVKEVASLFAKTKKSYRKLLSERNENTGQTVVVMISCTQGSSEVQMAVSILDRDNKVLKELAGQVDVGVSVEGISWENNCVIDDSGGVSFTLAYNDYTYSTYHSGKNKQNLVVSTMNNHTNYKLKNQIVELGIYEVFESNIFSNGNYIALALSLEPKPHKAVGKVPEKFQFFVLNMDADIIKSYEEELSTGKHEGRGNFNVVWLEDGFLFLSERIFEEDVYSSSSYTRRDELEFIIRHYSYEGNILKQSFIQKHQNYSYSGAPWEKEVASYSIVNYNGEIKLLYCDSKLNKDLQGGSNVLKIRKNGTRKGDICMKVVSLSTDGTPQSVSSYDLENNLGNYYVCMNKVFSQNGKFYMKGVLGELKHKYKILEVKL